MSVVEFPDLLEDEEHLLLSLIKIIKFEASNDFLRKDVDQFDFFVEHLTNAWGALGLPRSVAGKHWWTYLRFIGPKSSDLKIPACQGCFCFF